MNDARVIDVGAAIETQSGTPFSRLILILCCAAMVIEGYDVQVLAYAAPPLFAIGRSSRPCSARSLEQPCLAICLVQPC